MSIAFVDLQERRHRADYSILEQYRRLDALSALDRAKTAVNAYEQSDEDSKHLFATLLLCPPR